MCGICGVVKFERDNSIDRAVLGRMCDVITYRGPDDQGIYVGPGIGLGMRRLSIIDLSTGRQPVHNEDQSVWVVFNGEIYNFKELRKDLEKKGHRFYTSTDTEVIVHLYEEYGEGCVRYLRGMFAFALWDEMRQKLVLARDRLGIKPLYYYLSPRVFLFGSEIKSILQYPEIEREINLQALNSFLTHLYIPDPETIFKGIKKLPPAHILVVKNGAASIKRYWDLDFEPDLRKSEDEFCEILQAKIEESVKQHLVSDVPLGAFLSGGIDSSTIVAMMERQMGRPVKTFSIGFDDPDYDELRYARKVARHLGTEHYELVVKPDVIQILEDLVWHFDEPFADSSAIPTYMVSKLAREHVKVVLSGDGGDELFAGYDRYLPNLRRSRFSILPDPFKNWVLKPLSDRMPDGMKGRNFLSDISLHPAEMYVNSVSYFRPGDKERLYSADLKLALGELGTYDSFHGYFEETPSKDFLTQLLYLDTKTYLPGDILTKVDRMSMAHSLEVRVPFLDHELVELAATMPSRMKLQGSITKYILKKAMSNVLPNEILDRTKQGFAVPIGRWFNTQLKILLRDVLLDSKSMERGYFSSAFIEQALKNDVDGKSRQINQLWALFVLELWYRKYMDRSAGFEKTL